MASLRYRLGKKKLIRPSMLYLDKRQLRPKMDCLCYIGCRAVQSPRPSSKVLVRPLFLFIFAINPIFYRLSVSSFPISTAIFVIFSSNYIPLLHQFIPSQQRPTISRTLSFSCHYSLPISLVWISSTQTTYVAMWKLTPEGTLL